MQHGEKPLTKAAPPVEGDLRIGDKVEVIGKYEADFRGQDWWVAGIRVHDSGEGLDVTIAEQWPIPNRHWREYRGQTDGFRPEELRVVANEAATPVPVDASGVAMALSAGRMVLKGQGDGTYTEAENTIRLLVEALATPAPVAGNALDHIGGVFAGEGGMFNAPALDAGTIEACAKVAEECGDLGWVVTARRIRSLHGQSAGKPVGAEEAPPP